MGGGHDWFLDTRDVGVDDGDHITPFGTADPAGMRRVRPDVQRLERVDAELRVYLPLISRRSLQGETDGQSAMANHSGLSVALPSRSGLMVSKPPLGLPVDAASLGNAQACSPPTVRGG